MREIKCRGQHLINKEWLIGNLFIDSDGRAYISQAHHIESLSHAEFSRSFIEVDPNTVGQFTGLLDKNGKEIYEGDIVEHTLHPQIYYGTGSNDYNVHKGLICRYEVTYNHLQTSFEIKLIYVSEKGVKVGSVHKTEITIGDRYSLSSTDGYTPKCKYSTIGNIHD